MKGRVRLSFSIYQQFSFLNGGAQLTAFLFALNLALKEGKGPI